MTEETTQEAPEAEGNEFASNDAENGLEAATEQAPDEAEGEADPSGETGEQAEDTPDDGGKVPDGVQQRINEITRKRREAERRAERAEKRLKEMEAKNLDDLDFEDQIAERALNRSRRDQIETDRETAQELAREAYQARAEAASAKYPDFAQVAYGNHWNPTPAMIETIMDSDLGPEIAYHLGKNPSEAVRISQLSPASQARELGRIEATISAPKPAVKTAPKPVNPVGAKGSSGAKDPTKMTMAEYVAFRKAQGG